MIIYRKQLRSQKRRRRRWSELWVVATHARTHAREREWPEVNGSNPGSVEETVPRKTRFTTTDIYSIFRFPNGCLQFVDSMRSLTALDGIVLIQLKPLSESDLPWAPRRNSEPPSWFHCRGLVQLCSDTSHIDASAELRQGESEGKDVCDTSSVIAPLYNCLA